MSLEKFYRFCGIPKGVPRRIVKARKLRTARVVINTVRPQVAERDGYCRLSRTSAFGECAGVSEWAHLAGSRRFETRGQAPGVRHTAEGSLMLCKCHHQAYDSHALNVFPITDRGAEGLLRASGAGKTVLV